MLNSDLRVDCNVPHQWSVSHYPIVLSPVKNLPAISKRRRSRAAAADNDDDGD